MSIATLPIGRCFASPKLRHTSMTTQAHDRAPAPYWSWPGLAEGARMCGAMVPGNLLGAVIADPKRFGFDLMVPIFFAAMFVPLWRGSRRAIGWAVAGAVALLASYVLPGWWFVVVGALTGSVVGAFVDAE